MLYFLNGLVQFHRKTILLYLLLIINHIRIKYKIFLTKKKKNIILRLNEDFQIFLIIFSCE